MATKYQRGQDGYFSTRKWDGTYTADGKKRRKNIRSKKSSRDLENKVREFEAQVQNRKIVIKNDIRFVDYARKWLETYKADKEANTKAMYSRIIEKHLIQLEYVGVSDIQKVHIQLVLNNAVGHKRTQEQILMTFNSVMKCAVSDKLFPANELADILESIDKINYKAKEKRGLYPFEEQALFIAPLKEMDRIYLYLIYGCGFRRGETLALTVEDIDLVHKRIQINKAYAYPDNAPILKTPKSDNGFRTVPIPNVIYVTLKRYIEKLEIDNRSLLFYMKNGKPTSKSSFNKMWKRILAALQVVTEEQIEGLSSHIFRHNYCTNLCYQIPKISIKKIAQLMGDTEAMVLKVYNHILLEKEDSDDAINTAFSGEKMRHK